MEETTGGPALSVNGGCDAILEVDDGFIAAK